MDGWMPREALCLTTYFGVVPEGINRFSVKGDLTSPGFIGTAVVPSI